MRNHAHLYLGTCQMYNRHLHVYLLDEVHSCCSMKVQTDDIRFTPWECVYIITKLSIAEYLKY